MQKPELSLPKQSPDSHAGISFPGKFFAVGFGILIFLLLLLMLGIAFRFQAIMSHMDKVRDAWPPAVQILNARNASAMELLKSGNSESLKEFENHLAKARYSSLFEEQSPHLFAAERIIQNNSLSPDPLPPLGQLDALKTIEKLEVQRRVMQSDWLGATTVFLLRLKLPPYFLFD